MLVPFDDLPDVARIWIYSLDRPLEQQDALQLKEDLEPFLQSWQSHGRSVQGGWQLLEDRFILIGALIPEAEISGCGIDASVHAIESFAELHNYRLLSGLHLFYRDEEGDIQFLDRAAFRKMVRAGTISASTQVFDTSITSMQDLRSIGFEIPAGQAWHATVFRIPQHSPLH